MIKIYSLPNCSNCKIVKEYLDKNNIKYEDINLKAKENSEERVYWRSLGCKTAPIIKVDGTVYVYKDEESFIKFMESYLNG